MIAKAIAQNEPQQIHRTRKRPPPPQGTGLRRALLKKIAAAKPLDNASPVISQK
ncbi:hypothetical protein [Pannonibacter phragmitetus]|uniref:hypothetical protein n=1 Tax=Pannonibacter phragmitetus TaxID=121719 RepID=UPI00135B1DE8|nr:hypothetical protein [Pannonibacter phragmitetus]